jgi:hypothetical protein
MRRLPLVLALLAAVVLLATGCGSSGPSAAETYKAAFTPLNAEIISTGNQVGEAVTTAPKKSNAELSAAFARLSDKAAALAGAMVKLSPPKEVEADHQLLVSGLRKEAGNLNRIAEAAVKGDPVAAKQAAADTVTAAAGIRDPRLRLAEKLKLASPAS